jgi:predicted  nucleic acid-binding Zn-ribbon protein
MSQENELQELREENKKLTAQCIKALRIADRYRALGRPYPQWEDRWNKLGGELLELEIEFFDIGLNAEEEEAQ